MLGLAPGLAQAAEKAASQAEIDALRARVAALESQKSNPLRFNLSQGTSIQLYGYVKGDLIYDGDYSLGNTIGGLATIGLPTGPAAGNSSHGHARQSRFGLNIDAGDFTAKVEGDFFGAGNAFRLRHAYGQYKNILVGQTWTNFMPLEAYPGTVDFFGPAGALFARVAQVRYTWDNGAGLKLAGSVENDLFGTANSPAITASGKYSFDRGSVRVAAISRDITVDGANVNGWGVSAAAVGHLWQGGSIMAMYATGDAIADYVSFAPVRNAANTLNTGLAIAGAEVKADGITVGVSQDIGKNVTLAVAYGQARVDATTAATDTRKIETIHVSAFYKPAPKVKFGLEYITGTRTQANGAEFTADRIQFGAQFSF